MTTPDDVVQAARSYVGTRFKLQGRTKNGIDCTGLLVHAGRDAGLDVADTTKYNRKLFDISTSDAGKFFLDFIREQSDPIEGKRPVHGAIALLRQSTLPMHCGIIDFSEPDPMFIHANARKGVVRERWFLESNYRNLIEFRSYRGFD